MSYQVLARKWRPNCFAELVGQEHVVTAISNALDNNRLHHAYLFTGTRGVGKTTIARIFSKSLNCEVGLSATPCGKCSTCVEIDQGNFIDLLEIDAASRTKVEDTRELLDNVQYRPSRGRYKVYLIDEVHMLSKHSFNALLKTLEEPPPHVKFLLATTDPQKLPVTILSRCLQFNLKALSRTQIAKQLEFILAQEQLQNDTEALSQLARAAQGSMRDALSLTDQAIAQGNGVVSLSIVTAMLGLMDKNLVLKLLNAVLQKNNNEMMQLVEHMAMQSADFSQVLAELMSLLHQVALSQIVPEACKLETIAARAIFQVAKAVSAEHIQLLYQIVLNGKKDLAHAADPRSGVEMTLMRMLAFCPDKLNLAPQELAALGAQAATSKQTDIQPAASLPAEPVVAAELPEQAPAVTEFNRPLIQVDNADQQTDADYESNSGQDEETQNFNSSDYEQDLFEQQQAILNQVEDYGYAPQPDEHNSPHKPNEAAELPVQKSLSTTESMLALRKKLLQEQAAEEESKTKVKKSETNDVPNLAAWRPTKTVDNGSEVVAQDLPIADVKQETEPAPQVELGPESQAQAVEPTIPPWPMAEEIEQIAQDQPMARGDEVSAVPIATPLVEPLQETYAALDTHGHLALDELGDVTLDIPVFLQDQKKVMSAIQVDDWSLLIDNIQVTALTKQLALHSSFSQQGDVVRLTLLASKQHLNTPSGHKQLQDALAAHFGKAIELEIELGSPINTPFAIQQKIQKIRHDYAHQVISKDTSIALMQELFTAKVDLGSIQAR